MTLRVLFIVPGFPPLQNGGTEWETARRARWLAGSGHAVRVLSVDRAVPEGGEDGHVVDDVLDDIPVTRTSLRSTTGWHDRAEYDDPRLYPVVRRAIDAARPDVVHVMSGHRVTTSVIRASFDAGVPVVLSAMDFWTLCPRITLRRRVGGVCAWPEDPGVCVTCLANDWRRYRLPHQLTHGASSRVLQRAWHHGTLRSARIEGIHRMVSERRATLPAVLRQVGRVIVASRFLAGQLAPRIVAPEQLVVMRQGLDTQAWWPAEPAPHRALHVGYVGQIAEHKGVFDLIDAFRRLSVGPDDAKLIVHGDHERAFPAARSALHAQVDASPDVVLMGSFDNRAIRQIHAHLDVLVVPSRWYENSPNVILEAFACGTPVIAADLGGMAELVTHEVDGLLFPVGDVQALAATLRRLVEEPDLLPRLRAGIPPVKTIDEEMAELEQLYADVVAEHRVEAG